MNPRRLFDELLTEGEDNKCLADPRINNGRVGKTSPGPLRYTRGRFRPEKGTEPGAGSREPGAGSFPLKAEPSFQEIRTLLSVWALRHRSPHKLKITPASPCSRSRINHVYGFSFGFLLSSSLSSSLPPSFFLCQPLKPSLKSHGTKGGGVAGN